MIKVRTVKNKKELKAFIMFPYKANKGNPKFVPPLIKEEMKLFDSKLNPSYHHSDVSLWIAYKNKEVVGRVAGIINYKTVNKMKKKCAHFGWFDVINDSSVATKLLETLEEWAKNRKVYTIIGPLGFTNLDNMGITVNGFNQINTLFSTSNKAYYKEFIESNGYEKKLEWHEYETKHVETVPYKLKKVSRRAKKYYQLRVIRPNSKNDIRIYLDELLRLLNHELNRIFDGVDLNKKQMNFYKKRLLRLINPKFVRIILDDKNHVIGFGMAIPSYRTALQKAHGRWYLSFLYKLKDLYVNKKFDTFLLAITDEYVGKGISAIIYEEFTNLIRHKQIELSYTYLEMENQPVPIYKNFPRKQLKKVRIYQKQIN
ncbi:GNAT family N-acetyltransferase [Haloplasma contractile]|uniref:Gcn5-related N-acetyltransferase domain protein n=1 Tax=Haloplasma contractile SSD-17B TaxID=1033810 RepID=U2DUL1_9MOLU|nr:GNAT family N-acetyltransferase [Haloplasma contractile]ERJ12092.1 Gcn5-related N-acetyltransferase domain protein [Haloplasma contractile SSD-17B]